MTATNGFDFRGVVPPLLTPFTSDYEIDVPSLRRLVDYVVGGGVHGLWVLGAVGQFQSMTERQRDLVTDTVLEQVNGRVPVLVGCIDTSPDRSVERGRRSAAAGADGIFATAPIYDGMTQTEVLAHFRRIRESVDLPLVAYNAEYATQTPFAFETVRALAEDGTLAGIKDSADVPAFRRLLVELADLTNFRILTGHTMLLDAAMLMGAKGCVATMANLLPSTYVAVYDAALAGDWASARSHQDAAVPLTHVVDAWGAGSVVGNFVGAVKIALCQMGIIDSPTPGRPYPNATPAQVERIRAAATAVGLREAAPAR